MKDASVVGLPDERYGEVVAAFIVRNAGVAGCGRDGCGEGEDAGEDKMEEDIRNWVKEKLSHHLGEFRIFSAVQVQGWGMKSGKRGADLD